MKKGSQVSEEVKKKISEKLKKVYSTREKREKINRVLRGRPATEEQKKKLSEFRKGKAPWNKGLKMSEESKRKNRESHLGRMIGSNHWNWQGGITQEMKAGRPKPELCEVCGSAGKIVFDHNHQTGQFRGWICNSCNVSLGHARDSVEVLYKLIDYLNNSRNLKVISRIEDSKYV